MASKKPGLAIGKLLGAAALAGAIGGVVISLRQQRAMERQLDNLYLSGDRASGFQAPDARREDFMRADALALRGIPPYPGARPRKLSSNADVQGEPMSSAWFSTADSAEDVISFYRKAFNDLSSIKVTQMFSERAGYAGFFELLDRDGGDAPDFLEGRVHLVTAVRSGSQTLVFISNSRPQAMLGEVSPQLGDISLPDQAKARVLTVGEGELRKKSAFATVPGASVEQLQKHFEAAFANAGWKVSNRVADEQSRSLMIEATRGRQSAVLNLAGTPPSARFLLTVDEFSTISPNSEPVQ